MPALTHVRGLLATLLLALSAMPAGAAAPSSIRVVLDDNYPPYSFRKADGEPQGILKDLWELWHQRTGIAVDFQPMEWNKALAAMHDGKADVIDTIFDTEERRKQYDFSAPYASIEVSLFFDSSVVGIVDAPSAKGFTVGVKDGDACVDFLATRGITDLKYLPNYETLVQSAARREVHVLCIDHPPATYFFNRAGLASEFRHAPPLYTGQFHWAVPKGHDELRRVIEAGFAKITPEEHQAIENHWLGAPLQGNTDLWASYGRLLGYTAAAVLLLIGMLSAWSWTLRRRIAQRTRQLTATLDTLSQAEERFRTLFEQANDAIFIVVDNRIVNCNRRAEALYQQTRQQLIGREIAPQSSSAPTDGRPTNALLAEAIEAAADASTLLEWRDQLPDGSPLDVEVSLKRIDYDGTPALQAIVRDISERKRQEARIQHLLAEQRLIFDNAHVGILLLRNRRILKCNQRIADMFGFASPAELEGCSTQVFYCAEEHFITAGQQGYAALAESGFASLEVAMCRRDGSRIWVIQTGRTLHQTGRPLDLRTALEEQSIWVYTDITDRKAADTALRESRMMFSTAFESSPLAASIADMATGCFIEVNSNYERDFGWTKADLLGKSSLDVGLWLNKEARDDWIDTIRAEQRMIGYQTIWRTRNGDLRHVSLSSEIIELEGRACVLAYVTDITAEKQAEDALRIAATAFDSQESMLVTDANGVILRINRAFSESTGYAAEEVIGQTPRLLKSGRHDAEFYRTMWAAIEATGTWQGEIWDRRKNGEIYPKWLTISAVKDRLGQVTHYVGTHFDITERKRAEEQIRYLAFNDQLTGLANRFSLNEWLARTLGLASRNGRQVALMMIDLDNFKAINDTLGHHVGDQLLVEVASRLRSSVRQSDLVARLGGDEFIVVLSDLETPSDAAQIADKILSIVAIPCLVEGQELRTGASIGICVFPGDAMEARDLMKKADVAMYHAKSKGRGNYQFFREEIQQAALRRRMLESDLRRAIEQKQFLLYYQPQLDLRSGRIVGVEALIRWRHPERGLVPPLDFIPLAEETGLILPIGDWVLEEACRQISEWRSRGLTNLLMSVNLTASQFQNTSLPDRIQALLRQYDVSPSLLGLEITESMSMASPQQSIALMKELTERGLSLAIDDFGTGYSSLAYLKTFPVNMLKIDRSFVKDIEVDQNDAEICDVTVLLAHKLGLEVIAEGVETEAQLKYLLSIGCEQIQGYFISKPGPADEIEQVIRNMPPISWLGTMEFWGAETTNE